MNRTVCLLLLALTGCAHQDWSRNVYEGVRHRQEAEHGAGSVEPAAPPPDYEQYRRERDKLKNPPPASKD